MNSSRPAPHNDHDSFDPRWWLVPAALAAAGLLVALGGYVALQDTQQVAALAPPLHDVPIAPEPLGELSLPATAATVDAEPQEQPPTF